MTLIQKPVCTHVQDFLCTDTSGETHQHYTALYHNNIRDWDDVGKCKDIFSQAYWEKIFGNFPSPSGKSLFQVFLVLLANMLVEIFPVPLGKVNFKFS